jgi:hypothetical protein
VSTCVEARNIITSPYYIPESSGRQTVPDDTSQLPHDPGTGSSTYIGRSHYEGDAPVDETTARAYTVSRQTELSELEQKTLELWNVYALPPRAVHESLVEAFTEYCYPWMPVLEPNDLSPRDASNASLLLSQAVYLAASRVSSSTSVQAFSSSAEFYQRAKALYWVGHEKTPLTVIKAITMLHWFTPDGPAHVSYDTSEYWLKIGVGLAYQIGLHREPPAGPKRVIRRRMWWTLVVSAPVLWALLRPWTDHERHPSRTDNSQVRDSLISVSRGRPRAIHLEDADVSALTLEDFADSTATGELFIAYVEICRTLGDLVQGCSRRRLTPNDRSGVEAALFRWTRMLPLHLRLANYCAQTQALELRRHDFRARQLHVPYLACIIIMSRSGSPHNGLSPAAVFLARNLVCRLAPTFTTFGFMAGLVLMSLRPYPTLWAAAQVDLAILQTALQELSLRWRSAIGASKVIRKALQSEMPNSNVQNAQLPSLSRGEVPLFEGFPLELCRMWQAYENEIASQSMGIHLEAADARQIDPMAEVLLGLHGPQAPNMSVGLDFAPDDAFFSAPSFEGIPDYFWGDWGLP